METKARTLTERRKAATQLDIAQAAAELFTELGPDAVTTEAIAQRAGVALRTFYRYFRSKEDAVAPLLSVGAEGWRALLAAADPDAAPVDAISAAIHGSLLVVDESGAGGLLLIRGLLRAAQTDSALRGVWFRVNGESEDLLRVVVGERAEPDAAPATTALVAAAATAAIRIALEVWALTDDPPVGPAAPAELAVAAFRALAAGLPISGR
ncbi:TetR/AcrR family transcriptional regulator [Leifsonia poae]|uniref:TetR/AcrR family transcriptional regulator n=1 Tax=Leifsonia poae TaxID=110933 RepID=UPI001CC17EFD|nr:helix-turn-helix domain-containing protein [Leifsonia poae]